MSSFSFENMISGLSFFIELFGKNFHGLLKNNKFLF